MKITHIVEGSRPQKPKPYNSNPVAKNIDKFNKPATHRDRKNDYKRKPKFGNKDFAMDEKMKEKPYEKQIGMGDSRSEKEIRDQISGLNDGALKKWASKPAGRFGSKIAKLQDKLVAAEMKKRGLKESIEEARKDASADLYFNTYSAAVQHAKAQAEKKGFEVVEDDWFNQVTTGKGKPGRGKTTRHTLKLTKNGKPVRKSLSIQVYNRDTDKNTYELNFYVS